MSHWAVNERGSWRRYLSRICVIRCWNDVCASGSISAHDVGDVVVSGNRFLGSGRVGVWVSRLVLWFAVGLYCWGRGSLFDWCPSMLVVGPGLGCIVGGLVGVRLVALPHSLI